jgi:hypothetical protein
VQSPIVSVTVNGKVLQEGTDFIADHETAKLTRLGPDRCPCRWWQFPTTVQFNGGFAEVPDDVADAVVRMVTRRYSVKGQDPNLKSVNVPGVVEKQWWIGSGSQAGLVPPDIADDLQSYRVPVVA